MDQERTGDGKKAVEAPSDELRLRGLFLEAVSINAMMDTAERQAPEGATASAAMSELNGMLVSWQARAEFLASDYANSRHDMAKRGVRVPDTADRIARGLDLGVIDQETLNGVHALRLVGEHMGDRNCYWAAEAWTWLYFMHRRAPGALADVALCAVLEEAARAGERGPRVVGPEGAARAARSLLDGDDGAVRFLARRLDELLEASISGVEHVARKAIGALEDVPLSGDVEPWRRRLAYIEDALCAHVSQDFLESMCGARSVSMREEPRRFWATWFTHIGVDGSDNTEGVEGVRACVKHLLESSSVEFEHGELDRLAERAVHGSSCRLLAHIARRLWRESREQWTRLERKRLEAPAVTQVTLSAIVRAASPGASPRRAEGGGIELVDGDGVIMRSAPMAPGKLLSTILGSGDGLYNDVYFMNLLVYVVRAVHERCVADLEGTLARGENWMVLRGSGGINGLRQELGIRSKSRTVLEGIERALQAGAAWGIESSEGSVYGLWTAAMDIRDHRNPRRKIWEITVGNPLRPDGCFLFKSSAKILTPIPKLAPMVGRRNEHAALARYQLRVTQYLNEERAQLLKHEGVLVDENRRAELAHQVGLPESTIGDAWECWTEGKDGSLPFLEQSSPSRFVIADNDDYRKERDLMFRTAEFSARRSRGGKKSAEKRQENKRKAQWRSKS